MQHIFDFGISQDDATVEQQALDLRENDSLLCVSSAGEVPLNLLALKNINIKSVDVSINQNHLVNLKLAAIRALEPNEAAAFIGFTESTAEKRKKMFQQLSSFLSEEEILFWNQNLVIIENGPIHAARFEKYINKFNGIALRIIGKKNLLQLFELNTIHEQEDFFDMRINSFLLKKIFQITFHPSIYKNRGIDSEGLIYSKQKSISEFFFNKFRDFCCATIARKNYYLQFTFFNKILFQEAYPEYLQDDGISRIRKNYQKLEVSSSSYIDALEKSTRGEFNKFHLSNIGDWMAMNDYAELLRLINQKSAPTGRIIARYIYYKHPIPDDLKGYLTEDDPLEKKLSVHDKYPFYGITPIKIDKR